jgi:beta-lactamase superfamily II metal-dependent hydrolase
MLRIILFDVEHGFCAFIRTPTGRILLIDCGKAPNFSPVEYIRQHELAGTVPFYGHQLTKLIVTHPHGDHIEDIERLMRDMPPAILHRERYNWGYVKGDKATPGSYKCLDTYSRWETTYGTSGAVEPDYGMRFEIFGLGPNGAQAISASSNSTVNNSSLVIVATFTGTKHHPKFLFAGDMEEAGWAELLKNQNFRSSVAGVFFYFAAHHGHTSGFSTDLFKAMGKPLLNLVSVTSCDESHDDRYSSDDFSLGYRVEGEARKMLSTRCDGAICIDVDATGLPKVRTRHLPENLVKPNNNPLSALLGGLPVPPRR